MLRRRSAASRCGRQYRWDVARQWARTCLPAARPGGGAGRLTGPPAPSYASPPPHQPAPRRPTARLAMPSTYRPPLTAAEEAAYAELQTHLLAQWRTIATH